MHYRRNFVPGGSYFFTVVTRERKPIFQDEAAVDTLREAFRRVRGNHRFQIDAIVVLPDHLHCVWTLPPGDTDYPTRWRLIKTWFTRHYDPASGALPDPGSARGNKSTPWQDRYWEHTLRNEDDFIRHVDYIHHNPVKHGYATMVADWPYSSFHRYVRAGIYPSDWEGDTSILDGIGRE